MIEFCIYGNPVAQARGRAKPFKKADGQLGAIVYDPQNAKEWKQLVRAQAVLHRRTAVGLIQGPIFLTLNFYLLRPKSLPKKVKHHIKRPDLDNLVKAVKDGLKGIIYREDSQVWSELAAKHYCNGTEPPRVEVVLEETEG